MHRSYLITALVIFLAPSVSAASARFFFDPLWTDSDVTTVAVAGSFNGWSPQMMTCRNDGTWELILDLPKGIHHYKFVVFEKHGEKHWIPDPSSSPSLSIPDGHGSVNSGVIVGAAGEKALLDNINVAALLHDPSSIDDFNVFSSDTVGAHVEIGLRTLEGDATSVTLNLNGAAIPLIRERTEWGWDYYGAETVFSAKQASLASDTVEYFFLLKDSEVSYAYGDFVARSTPAFPTPEWAKNVVWYQIMLDRWRNGEPANDPDSLVPWRWDWFKPFTKGETSAFYQNVWNRMYGGDLQGLSKSLDYLEALGVTGLYFNPLFEAPGHHKYNASDYRHIDDNFGYDTEQLPYETDDPNSWTWTATDKLFLKFLATAHARGFKVILDGVFNHTGTDFWAFRDVARDTVNSRYRQWYDVTNWDSFTYRGWAGYAGLPEFAEDSGGLVGPVRKHIFDINGETSNWRVWEKYLIPHSDRKYETARSGSLTSLSSPIMLWAIFFLPSSPVQPPRVRWVHFMILRSC